MQSRVSTTRSATGGFRVRCARYARGLAGVAFAVLLSPQLPPAAGGAATPPGGEGGTGRPAMAQGAEHKSVLILSGTQYGLPVSDAVNAGAVAALKEKGVSVNDIYVESLDIVMATSTPTSSVMRTGVPCWRAC